MKVNVYGLTEATISFNTLGMILRGKYHERASLYNPCSAAYNLVIENDSQMSELRSIANLGLIRIEEIEEPVVDNVPQAVPQAVSQEQAVKAPQSPKAKNPRRKEKEQPKVEEPEVEELSSAVDLEVPRKDSKVVVMTSKGPVTSEMVHKASGEIDENDPRCEKSMKAAKAIDEGVEMEEALDEGAYVDPSEREGSNAVIGTGSGKASVVEMKNTIFGERADPQYIDLDENDEIANAFIDDDVEGVNNDEESAFIGDEDDEDDLGDAFIEI